MTAVHEVFVLDVHPNPDHWQGMSTHMLAEYTAVLGAVPPLSDFELTQAQRAMGSPIEVVESYPHGGESDQLRVVTKPVTNSHATNYHAGALILEGVTSVSNPSDPDSKPRQGSVLRLPLDVRAPFKSDHPGGAEAREADLEEWQLAVSDAVLKAAGKAADVVGDAADMFADRDSANRHYARVGRIPLVTEQSHTSES